METIISIAIDFLKKYKEATFDEIFIEIQKRLMPKWEKQLPNESAEQILVRKRGELYKLLTIDGSFTPLGDNLWSLRSDLL
ncbi:DNA-directed RNA polymerase subunit delta [Mesomycoplasma bovoculi]|uniref:Putative DNA-directed RNA polymerase, delta subunit n=1 Tax=Mesomycoplasma bovoculi M165/69 TaxID=743966 RepID=W5UTG6_9BACT|nr:DNA-directed RNA polymerase subunit delta [Mesomycoplasma bovoculi]AHH45115.1 putative DNA-directed RNA polymerase, delta subunit [Mesomycoplasma bovoculi M165/69]